MKQKARLKRGELTALRNQVKKLRWNLCRQWVDTCKTVKEFEVDANGFLYVIRNSKKALKTRNFRKALVFYKGIAS